MKPAYHYCTVLEALDDLKQRRFYYDFNLNHQAITENPNHYSVEHVYRYEGDSDPDEESLVYGIISDSGEKGILVADFSVNSDNEAVQILEKLYIDSKE